MTKPEGPCQDDEQPEAQDTRLQPFDLEQRTGDFGEAVVQFARTIARGPVTSPLISQLVRSATSVGANYAEANDAESKKDSRHKIALCRKESSGTKHWLRMIVAAEPALKHEACVLWQEAKELNLIFGAILRSRGK